MNANAVLEERLRKNRRKFVNNLKYFDDVLDILLEFNKLTHEQCQRIKAECGDSDKVRKLIDIIPTREDPSVVFYYALLETKQFELATIVRPDLLTEQQRDLNNENFAKESIKSTNVPSDQDYESYQPDILPADWPDLNPAHKEQRFNFNVQPAVTDPRTVAKLHSKLNYTMKNNPRGRVYIINNHFSGGHKSCFDQADLPYRTGTDEDELALVRLFKNKEMMFTVDGPRDHPKHEVTAERMRRLLKIESERKDHGDCFILCILSHGLKDAIYGTDGQYISVEEIINMFDDKNCEGLAGKPKLFFIQACRGEEKEMYLKSQVTGIHTTEEGTPLLNPSDIMPLQIHDHCFIAYATTPGTVSWRDEKQGSLFIQAVVRIFWAFAYKDELCSLMTKVNNLVNKSKCTVSEEIQGKKIEYVVKQTSVCRNHLKKGFYFFPGISQ